jgi:hypothetical protein
MRPLRIIHGGMVPYAHRVTTFALAHSPPRDGPNVVAIARNWDIPGFQPVSSRHAKEYSQPQRPTGMDVNRSVAWGLAMDEVPPMNLKKTAVEAAFVTALGVTVFGLGGGVGHATPLSHDPAATTWAQRGHGGWYWGPGGDDGGGGWGGPGYWAPPPPPPAWGYPGYYGGWGNGGWGC